jgi:hypothetical protein
MTLIKLIIMMNIFDIHDGGLNRYNSK